MLLWLFSRLFDNTDLGPGNIRRRRRWGRKRGGVRLRALQVREPRGSHVGDESAVPLRLAISPLQFVADGRDIVLRNGRRVMVQLGAGGSGTQTGEGAILRLART